VKTTLWISACAILLGVASPNTNSLELFRKPHLANDVAVPQMEKLANALVGDWKTVEVMNSSDLFPTGGTRDGIVHTWLTGGGTALVYEVHSDGTAGRLDGMLIIWWDNSLGAYRVFTCFGNPDNACQMRGTARWAGSTLVNEYEESLHGKSTKWRDSFTFSARSYVLTASLQRANGSWETMITTRASRQ
jgi:hypothetical protein